MRIEENIIQKRFKELHRYLVKNDFSGFEYDDLLASHLVNSLTFNSLYLKIAAVQFAKRFPFNIRRLLGVKKLKSTKAFGFIIKGYLHYYLATGDDKFNKFASEALNWLIRNMSSGYSGSCWGNDFDFASRAGFFPKGLPTVVWTSHIQEAFDLAYKVFNKNEYKDIVISSAEFVRRDLERMEDKTGFCFAYSPGILKPVHNSNLLGAVALLRAWKYTKDNELLELAKKSINWSTSKINNDGSWFYGDIPMLHWIDNYHTAYNLDCLCKSSDIAGKNLVDSKIIKKTYNFWKNNFFTSEFVPKFYYNKVFPVDIQASAQAIETFSRYSIYEKDAIDLAENVLNWVLKNMSKNNGSFLYRKYKYWTNNLEPVHWGEGTMLSAMGYFFYYSNKINKKRIRSLNEKQNR